MMNSLATDVLVVGGGVAGMEAAATLADMGLDATLLERQETLGGHAAHWACMATDECGRCSACLVADSVARVAEQPRVRVLTHAETADVVQADDGLTVTVEPVRGSVKTRVGRPDWMLTEPATIRAGRVVLATGFEPFDAKNHRLLGYGHLPEVFTTRDVDDALRRDDLAAFLPADPALNRIAFIQCVGSRDRKNGREYCSQFCCKTSIRLVNRLKHLRPDLDVTIYYIDLQIMGKEFRAFYEAARGKIRFMQGVPAEVRTGGTPDRARLVGIDPRTGLGLEEEYNRVVLSVGMAPNPRAVALARKFGLTVNEYGFIESATQDGLIRTANPRVVLAGACAGPADIPRSRLQALAAARRIVAERCSRVEAVAPTAASPIGGR